MHDYWIPILSPTILADDHYDSAFAFLLSNQDAPPLVTEKDIALEIQWQKLEVENR